MIGLYLENMKYEIEPEVKELCLSGILDNSIADALGETREWVKQRMMDALLFTRTNASYTLKFEGGNERVEQIRKFVKYCSNAYPKFFKALIMEKQRLEALQVHPDNWINAGGSELAKRIQRMESEIWIHTLLKELPENLFYATIHDSIMIFDPTVEDVINTRNKILEVGYRLHGIMLPLKLEFHNIDKEEKAEYHDKFSSNLYQPELNDELTLKNTNTTCFRILKFEETVTQDTQERPCSVVSSDTFVNSYWNENGELVVRNKPKETV